MKIKYIIGALAGLCSFSTCTKPTIGLTEQCNVVSDDLHSKAQQYRAILDDAQQKRLPGITLLIKDREGIWTGSAGWADIGNKVAMQPCHIAKVASITKLFMGVLTLQLAAEQQLVLDSKISDYLDAATLKGIANADQVTVRQLLNHTSGIYDVIKDTDFYLSVLNDPPSHRTQQDILSFVRNRPAAFAAGSRAGYSNTNTLLLSMIIDRKVGDHAALLRSRIIEPLGLSGTCYYYHDRLPEGKVAQGYYDLYNNGTIANLSSYNTGSGNGYTGIYSSVSDLLKFSEALFEHKTLLPGAYLDTMLTFNNYEEEGSNRLLGLGVMKDFLNRGSDFAYGHRGRDLAYSADLFYFPARQITMVLIVNYGTDGNSALRPVFFDIRDRIVSTITE